MTSERFEQLKAELHASATGIADGKRPGYTQGNTDVLHNFKAAAKMAGITPLQAWSVYFWKHIAATLSYAKDPTLPQAEPMLGRISDARNYLDLFYGLVVEQEELAKSSALANTAWTSQGPMPTTK